MNRYSTRLSRNELYSYGFKEGQPWAEDRRALESALRELEREIWQPSNFGRLPSTPPAHAWYHPASTRVGGFPQYPRYMRVDGSNDSEPYSFSQSSPRRPLSGANGRRASHHRLGEDIPPFMPDPMTCIEGSPDRFFAQPQSSSSSSYRGFRAIENSPEFPEPQYASNNRGSSDAARQPAEFPGHTELVRYRHGAEREQLPYSGGHSRNELQAPSIPSSNTLSLGWSVTATRGTSDSARSSSPSYSQGHSDDSAPLEYSRMPASSGYVESYDVSSHENYYPHESDDDHEYMSDGDEGIYCSSEFDDGYGYDNSSDEGYYSEDAGGSYDGDDYD